MGEREKIAIVIQGWADETLGTGWKRHVGILTDRLLEAGIGDKSGMIQQNNRIVCKYCGSPESVHVCVGSHL